MASRRVSSIWWARTTRESALSTPQGVKASQLPERKGPTICMGITWRSDRG